MLSRKRRAPRDLLSLDVVAARLRAVGQTYVGVRPIPLGQIVGSDGRVRDFDRIFSPRRDEVRNRLARVAGAFPEGEFPPITAYRLGDAYFVVDGHHRVALARRLGMETIDAEVTRMRARWPLTSGADAVELTHAEQEWRFFDESGLGRARPRAHIRFSRPVGYRELLDHVERHGYRLMLDRARVLTRAEVAADWFDRVYQPLTRAIRASRLKGACANATDADLFLWIQGLRRGSLAGSTAIS
jgi:hypothetical protein